MLFLPLAETFMHGVDESTVGIAVCFEAGGYQHIYANQGLTKDLTCCTSEVAYPIFGV